MSTFLLAGRPKNGLNHGILPDSVSEEVGDAIQSHFHSQIY